MKKFLLTLATLMALLAVMSITASAAKVVGSGTQQKENIAAGKTVTSTYENRSSEGELPAENLVDGKPGTSWEYMAVMEWSPEGYVIIDLGAQYTISGITLFNYLYPAQYCICSKWTYSISSDGENFTELAQCKLSEEPSEIGAAGYSGASTGDMWIPKKDQVVEGRYIKWKVDDVYVGGTTEDRKDIRVYELEVYGELKAGEDKPAVDPAVQAELDAQAAAKKAEEENKAWFAARKEVSRGIIASTNLSNTNGIERLTDGDTTQDYTRMYDVGYATDDDKNPWLAFDFGGTYKLEAYRMNNYRWAENRGRVSSWEFQVSNDGKTWTTVHTVTGLKEYTEKDEYKLDQPVEARYARINITETTGGPEQPDPSIKIYEIAIFADPDFLKVDETKKTETKTETKQEEKKEETKTETKTDDKKEETAPAATTTETTTTDTKKEETKKETKTETKQEEKKEETKTDDTAAPADDTAAPAEESSSNTGLIIGIIAAVVVVAAVLALVLKKKKK